MLQFDTQPAIPWAATGTLTVTSVRPNSSNAAESVTVYATYPGPIKEHQPTNGVFQSQDCKVTFASTAVSFDLKPRDTLTFDSKTWTVRQAQRFDFLKFWDVQCFRLIVPSDLQDTIAVYRGTSTAGSDGFRSATLAAVNGLSSIPGRLQPDGWTEEPDVDGKLVRRRRWKAYLSTAADVRAADNLVVSGTYYEVKSQDDIERFDSYTVVTCEELD